MALLDDVFPELESLRQPIAAESPAGEDLDGSLELNALEMACAEPDEPVLKSVLRQDTRNWREIRTQAHQLLLRSKDLRVAVQLSRALLQLDGLPGFCGALGFLTTLIRSFWDELYPALDPDESDAIPRVSPIQELVSSPVLAHIRLASLFSSPDLRRVTVNDVLVAASSPLGRVDLVRVPAHEVYAAIDTLGVEALHENLQLVESARKQLSELKAAFYKHTGVVVQLDALSSSKGQPGLLDAVYSALKQEYERLLPESEHAGEADGGESLAIATVGRGLGDISRREDVVMLLDRICAYYSRVEPSSPVPLLLQRAKRVAMMDFLAIVRDLADQGLDQVGMIAGISVK